MKKKYLLKFYPAAEEENHLGDFLEVQSGKQMCHSKSPLCPPSNAPCAVVPGEITKQ